MNSDSHTSTFKLSKFNHLQTYVCYLSLSTDKIHRAITYIYIYIYIYIHPQGVSRLVDIITGGDFPGLCDQKSSYEHVSDFGRLLSYDRLKLRIGGNDY